MRAGAPPISARGSNSSASPATISRRPGYRSAISASAAIARSSRSTAITRRAPAASSARVSPPGPGPISTTVQAVERARRARDARGQVEIEQEILAERFLGAETVSPDHLAQRRKIVDGAHASTPVCGHASSAAGAPGRGPRACRELAGPRSDWRDRRGRCRRCRRRCRDRARCARTASPSVTLTAWSKASVLIGISAWS